MRGTGRKRWPALGLAVCSALHLPGAIAAEPLEELIVTAQKRTDNLQTSGLAGSVLSEELLRAGNIDSLEFVQYAVPSATVSNYGFANTFNIRGIGRSEFDIHFPSGVVVYRDGAPMIAGFFQNEPYFDIESIEVLRGPQGTFVGKSASAGAVFINSRDPEPGDTASGSVEIGFGSDDLRELTGIVNLPLTDAVSTRVAFKHLDSSDYFDSISGDFTGDPGERRLDSVRLGVMWRPSDKLEAVLKIDHHDLDFGGSPTTSLGDPLHRPTNNGEFALRDKSTRVVGDVAYTFDNGLLVRSLTAYHRNDNRNYLDLNGSAPAIVQFRSNADVDIVSQELNIVSPSTDAFRWVAGALYYRQNLDLPPWDEHGVTNTSEPFGLDFPWLSAEAETTEQEWSVFGSLEFDLTETLELEVGARFSSFEKDAVTDVVFGDGLSPPTTSFTDVFLPTLGLPSRYQKSRFTEESVDWRVALNWSVRPSHFVYALVSRGHTAGSFNPVAPYAPYDEMGVVNYETGWKAGWLEDRVRTQATVFYQDVSDLQIKFNSPEFADLSVAGEIFRNAQSDSRVWGIELSSQAYLGNWQGTINLSYLDSAIGRFENLMDPLTAELVDGSGERFPFMSERSASALLGYEFHFGSGWILLPSVGIAHASEFDNRIWDHPQFELESRTLVTLNARLFPGSERWEARIWVSNALDEEYVAAMQEAGNVVYAGRPREFGARFAYRF